MKRFGCFVLLVILLSLIGCSSEINFKDPVIGSDIILKQVDLVSEELSKLGTLNSQWLTSRSGWIHIVSRPSVEGIMKFTYQERWTHYQEGSSECVEEMHIIRRTEDSEDGQFRIHTPEGFEGELIGLRQKIYFSDSYDENQVEPIKCKVSDRSAPMAAMRNFLQNEEFITEVSLSEQTLNGVDVLVFNAHYQGGNSDQLGIPDNAIGKMETIYYDKATGNRIRFELVLEFPNGVWDGETYIEDEVTFLDSLPEEVQKKLESAIKELNYYLD